MATERKRPVISDGLPSQLPDIDPEETTEWVESLDGVIEERGPKRARYIMLRLLERAEPGELARAIGRALELGIVDADAVRLILEHRRERPVGLFCLDGRPHLQSVAVPAPDLSAYTSLAAGVSP